MRLFVGSTNKLPQYNFSVYIGLRF